MDELTDVLYEVDNGAYPTTAQGLEALRTEPSPKPKKWKEYSKKDIPMDPWGNPYQVTVADVQQPDGTMIQRPVAV